MASILRVLGRKNGPAFSVVISDTTIDVVWAELGPNLYGDWDCTTNTIRLNNKLTAEAARRTFLHEALHATADILHYRWSEKDVRAIEVVLGDIFLGGIDEIEFE